MDENNYAAQGEPELAERSYYWRTAIGLRQVDRLTPSKYLLDAAKENIDGRITLDEADKLVTDYYKHKPATTEIGKRGEEADKVSLRIARILSENTFTLSPVELIAIHKRLFDGVVELTMAWLTTSAARAPSQFSSATGPVLELRAKTVSPS